MQQELQRLRLSQPTQISLVVPRTRKARSFSREATDRAYTVEEFPEEAMGEVGVETATSAKVQVILDHLECATLREVKT